MTLKSSVSNRSADPERMRGYYDLAFMFGVLVFLYLQLFILPNTPVFLEKDHLIYTHNAMRMLEGEVIFKDFFQFIVPGSEVVYLALFFIFGVEFWILNAVVLTVNLGTAWLMLKVGREVLPEFATYLPPLVYLVFGARWLGLEGSHRWFCIFFVLLAVHVLLRSKGAANLIIAGSCLGIATCFTQTTGLVAFIGIAAILGVELWRKASGLKTILIGLLKFSVPFLAVALGFVLYFASTAGFQLYWDQTVVFLVENAPADIWNKSGAFLLDLPDTLSPSAFRIGSVTLFYYLLFPTAYVGFIATYFLKRKNGENPNPAIWFIAIIGVFLLLSLQVPTGVRLYQLSPFGLILLCWVLIQTRSGTVLAKTMFCGLIVLGILLPLRTQMAWNGLIEAPTGEIAFLSQETFERYEWVALNTRPGDYIFDAHHPDVYFPFLLRNPTRMYYVRPTRFTPPHEIDGVVESLERRKPEVILWNVDWSVQNDLREEGDRLGLVFGYMNANYDKIKDFAAPHSDVKTGTLSLQAWKRKSTL